MNSEDRKQVEEARELTPEQLEDVAGGGKVEFVYERHLSPGVILCPICGKPAHDSISNRTQFQHYCYRCAYGWTDHPDGTRTGSHDIQFTDLDDMGDFTIIKG